MRIFTTSLPLGIAFVLSFVGFRLLAQNSTSEWTDPEAVLLNGQLQRQVMRVGSPEQHVVFQNLLPGETYLLKIPKNPLSDICLPSIQLLVPGDQLLSYNDTLHELRFKANAVTMEFLFAYNCSWNAEDPPTHYVSLLCQTCKKKTLQSYMESVSAGELAVTPGVNAHTLIRDVLIGGDCFDVSNVSYQGQPSQIGTFSNGQTNIGIAEGVIMATGNALVATGPNDSDNADMGFAIYTPDADLGELSAGGDTYDMANLEFDFRPTQSSVAFEFVFASEEYCEYVGSEFNDAFGFFISGPGISGPFNGAENIALVPTTPTYVAINNVNHLFYPAYFTNNTPPTGLQCGQTGVNTPAVNQIQFDGFTKKITVRANLQTCKTYHIKLKIADVADGIFDSAVFLKAGSFDAGSNASVQWVVDGQMNALEAYENCGQVSLLFRRVGGNLGQPLTVNYTVSGSATAGLDFSGIPASVTIPAGQSQVIVPVSVIGDALQENPETIQVMLANLCNCSRPQEILTILDVQPFQIDADTVLICAPGAATLGVQVSGGAAPYIYHWENNSNTPTITPNVTGTQQYRVTVTDNCGFTKTATARVTLAPPLTAQLQTPGPELCFGQADSLVILFQGLAPYTLQYTLDGVPQTPVSNIQSSPFKLLVTEPGLYQLTSISNADGCVGAATGALEVTEAFVDLNADITNVSCAGLNDGSILSVAQGGQSPYTYTWSGPQAIPPNSTQPTDLQAGTYNLTVADALGCKATGQYTVVAPDPLLPTVAGTQGTDCDNPNVGTIDLEVIGGDPGYTYLWSNAALVQDPQNLVAGPYTVTVTDQSGCSATTMAEVPGNFTLPVAVADTTGALSCTTLEIALDGSGSSPGSSFSYLWTASNGGHISSGETTLSPLVNAPGTYTLVVRNNVNGCSVTAAVQQISIVDPPAADGGPDQELTCVLTNAALDASGSTQGGAVVYQWTASNGGAVLAGANTQQPLVGNAGTYTLLVTDNNNGCSDTDVVIVTDNKDTPVASVATPDSLTCLINAITLEGNSTPNAGVTYQWVTADGNIQSGQTSLQAVITEPGLYTLISTYSQNGCADSASVAVAQNYAEPLALVIPSNELDCNHSFITLDGQSSILGGNTTFVWSTNTGHFVSGETTLTPIINEPGAYTLVLTNSLSNCSSSATVLIENDTETPYAEAGNPALLTCDVMSLTLGDITANPAFVYTWTTANGGNITEGENTPTPGINAPGTYILSVFNPENGCAAVDSVVILQNNQLPLAVANHNGALNCINNALQLNGAGSSVGPNFSYQWSSSTGNGIGAGMHTLTPTVTAPATYTLSVTNEVTGCQATASTTVTTNAVIPNVTAIPTGVLTCTNTTVQLNAAGTTTGQGVFYLWGSTDGAILSGQGTLLATVGEPGFYTLRVSNINNSCSSTYTIEVQQDTSHPTANAGAGDTLLCTLPGIVLDGSGSDTGPDIVYQWSVVSDGHFTSATNIQNPSIDEPGLYQIQVTDTGNGCSATDQVEIDIDPAEPLVQIVMPGILSCTVSQLELDAGASSNGSNFSYQWTGPGIVGGAGTPLLQVDAPGDYLLAITNTDNGCTSSAMVAIVRDTLSPAANAGTGGIINCYNVPLEIGDPAAPALPHLSYTWTGPGIVSGGNTGSPLVDTAGIYALVVLNSINGCSATDDVLIGVDFDAPQADAGDTYQLSCAVVQHTLNASASQGTQFDYAWSTDTGSFVSAQDTLHPTVNGKGTYTLTVTNVDNGCSTIDSVFIDQSTDAPQAVIVPPDTLTCAKTSIVLNGSGSSTGFNYLYAWTAQAGGNIVTGAQTLTPTINEPGVYTLQVTDLSNNCVTYSNVTVLENIAIPVIVVDTGKVITCSTPIITLGCTALPPGTFAYQWVAQNGGFIVGGVFTNHPIITSAGTYLVYALNLENGCLGNDSIVVPADQDSPDLMLALPDTLSCITLEAALTPFSSVSTLEFEWSTINGHFSDLTDPAQVLVDEPGIYEVIATNTTNGCSTVAVREVLANKQAPVAEAGISSELSCSVTSLALNGSGSSMGSQYFYQWSTSDGEILTGPNSLTPTIVKKGTYRLVVVNENNGCMSEDQVVINSDTLLPAIVIPLPEALTCMQSQVVLQSQVTTGSGAGNIVYAWTTTNGSIVSGESAPSLVVDATGNYTLAVIDTQNGCTNTASTVVTDNIVLPNADAGAPLTLTCNVQQKTLQGVAAPGAGYSYTWSTQNGQIISGANTLTPLVGMEGIYSLTVLNQATGCKKTDAVEVFQETNVPTDIAVQVERPSCKDNDGIILFTLISGGVGPYLYSINNGSTFESIPEFEDLAPGVYNLMIRDANGCEFSEEIQVPMGPDPNISVVPEINLTLGESYELQAVVASYPLALIDTVIWTPLEGLDFEGNSILQLLNPTIRPYKSTEYTVTIISVDGCSATDRVLVNVDDEPHIYIPNAFSPWNSDNQNDIVFIFANIDQVPKIRKFYIFDRWGEMVFEAENFSPNDPDFGWDGRFRGKLLDPAVFVYYAEIEIIDGRITLKYGDITLVK